MSRDHALRGSIAPSPARDARSVSRLESTAVLFERIRAGDARAREALMARFHPLLLAWGHGRLPMPARGLNQTDDLVQRTFMRALAHLDRFQAREPGAFLAYLRVILRHLILDEIRRSRRGTTVFVSMPDDLVDSSPTPLDDVEHMEALAAYDAALQRLSPRQQEALVLRLEFDVSYERIRDVVGCRTSNAARMLVVRATRSLVREMRNQPARGEPSVV